MNKLKQPKPKLFFDTRGIGSTVLFLAALVNYLGVRSYRVEHRSLQNPPFITKLFTRSLLLSWSDYRLIDWLSSSSPPFFNALQVPDVSKALMNLQDILNNSAATNFEMVGLIDDRYTFSIELSQALCHENRKVIWIWCKVCHGRQLTSWRFINCKEPRCWVWFCARSRSWDLRHTEITRCLLLHGGMELLWLAVKYFITWTLAWNKSDYVTRKMIA